MDKEKNNVQNKKGNNMKELNLDDLDVVSGGVSDDQAIENYQKGKDMGMFD